MQDTDIIQIYNIEDLKNHFQTHFTLFRNSREGYFNLSLNFTEFYQSIQNPLKTVVYISLYDLFPYTNDIILSNDDGILYICGVDNVGDNTSIPQTTQMITDKGCQITLNETNKYQLICEYCEIVNFFLYQIPKMVIVPLKNLIKNPFLRNGFYYFYPCLCQYYTASIFIISHDVLNCIIHSNNKNPLLKFVFFTDIRGPFSVLKKYFFYNL